MTVLIKTRKQWKLFYLYSLTKKYNKICLWQGADKLNGKTKSSKDSHLYYKFIYDKIAILSQWDKD